MEIKSTLETAVGIEQYLNKDIKEGEVILHEAPLVMGPAQLTVPVCLGRYVPVDGSYKCPRSGWPMCGPTCAKASLRNPEVVVPSQCEAVFEIEEYYKHSYMYECIIVLRALLLKHRYITICVCRM